MFHFLIASAEGNSLTSHRYLESDTARKEETEQNEQSRSNLGLRYLMFDQREM